MRDSLRKGNSLDELWKVARGEIKYGDFISKQKGGQKKRKPAKLAVKVPEELVSLISHVLNSGC
jgi:hypothetical protein